MLNAPKELFSSILDALQRGEIEFQPDCFFVSRLLEILDSRLGPVFASRCYIHFGVLVQQCLHVFMRGEGVGGINNSFRPGNKEDRVAYLGGLFANASVSPSNDDDLSSQVRNVVDGKLGLRSKVTFDDNRIEYLPDDPEGGESAGTGHA